MKISLSWLSQFIDIKETPEELAQKLTACGLEVEEIEERESIPGGLKGLVIGQVLTCARHPNADKLSVTTVDIGTGEPLPIVCGAPNVAAGQKVIVATVGAQLYPTHGEPFKISKSKIRGEISQGMICAEDEIGLGNSHEGIMVLETDLPVGTPAADYFGLKSDYILTIGLTPNRADAASHFGVARDLAAVLGRDLLWSPYDGGLSACRPEPLTSGSKLADSKNETIPNPLPLQNEENLLPFVVHVRDSTKCPRYTAVAIKGVTVKDSPDWLKKRLESIGLKPINNVVDITNYILHGIGQPLHAFDADKIAERTIIVKTCPQDTSFITLDGVERKLSAEDLMICDAEKPICMAGVFGGLSSGITAQTRNVIIESAYFAPESIRKTSQYHHLKTDASFRFERGTDPNLTIPAARWAADLIVEIAGGKIASPIQDYYPNPIAHTVIDISYAYLDKLIGQKIPVTVIHSILSRLEIQILKSDQTHMTVSVPPYRVDVRRPADIAEEVLRIYGFERIELKPDNSAAFLARFPKNDPDKIRSETAKMLAASGFFQIVTTSLSRESYWQKFDWLDKNTAVATLNPLSEEFSILRQNPIPTAFEVIAHNLNRKQKNLKLFEIAKTYHKTATSYLEKPYLALFVTGLAEAISWQTTAQKADFFVLKNAVHKVLQFFGISKYQTFEAEKPFLVYGLSYMLGKDELVHFGMIKPSVGKHFDIKQEVYFAQFDWNGLIQAWGKPNSYEPVPKFPVVERDLSLVLDKKITFQQIEAIARKTEKNLLHAISLFDVYQGSNLGDDTKKAYAITFSLLDREKTLTDEVIEKTMQKLIAAFEKDAGALIRK